MNALVTIEALGHPGLALDLPRDLDHAQWCAIGERLSRADVAMQWLIGDWWNAGEPWGERVEDAKRIFPHLSHQTMRNYGTVATKFEVSRRRDSVDWSRHAETVSLPSVEADKLLARAAEADLSVREVRVEVVKTRTRLGLHPTRDTLDDDPAHTAARSIAHAWNRAPEEARAIIAELILEAVEERDASAARGDAAYLRNIDP